MNLDWTYVEAVLWIEVAFCTLLLLPMITREMWHEIFQNKYVRALKFIGEKNYYVFVLILAVVFFDAARDWYKYSSQYDELETGKADHSADIAMQMKLYRAQRNFYVTGVCLFMIFVIKRLFTVVALKKAETHSDSADHKRRA